MYLHYVPGMYCTCTLLSTRYVIFIYFHYAYLLYTYNLQCTHLHHVLHPAYFTCVIFSAWGSPNLSCCSLSGMFATRPLAAGRGWRGGLQLTCHMSGKKYKSLFLSVLPCRSPCVCPISCPSPRTRPTRWSLPSCQSLTLKRSGKSSTIHRGAILSTIEPPRRILGHKRQRCKSKGPFVLDFRTNGICFRFVYETYLFQKENCRHKQTSACISECYQSDYRLCCQGSSTAHTNCEGRRWVQTGLTFTLLQ